MINLLPTSYKAELRQEARFRVFATIGIALVATLISFALLLLAIQIYLQGSVSSEEAYLSTYEHQNASTQEARQSILQWNKQLASLSYFYTSDRPPYLALQKLASDIPSGLFITELDYVVTPASSKAPEKAKLSLNGFAPTRVEIEQLQTNLKRDSLFTDVVMPPSNWTEGPKNVTFSATMNVDLSSTQSVWTQNGK